MAEKTMKIKIAGIRVPECFLGHPPKPEKVRDRKAEYEASGKLLPGIAVTRERVLVDGYAAYIALKELGVDETDARIRDTAFVVAGHHPNYPGKAYKWRCRPSDHKTFKPGDSIAVATRKGLREAIVECFETMPAAEAVGFSSMIGKWDPARRCGGNGKEGRNAE